jgi:beta-glucosidase
MHPSISDGRAAQARRPVKRANESEIVMDSFAEQKALLTTGADYWSTHEVSGLGLRSIRLSDGPHGLRVQDDDNPDHLGLGRSLPATCFPPAATLASSWDPHLVRSVGAALGREARALGVDVVLGPGVEIKRSPLCGRNFEYYSEDPLLAGRLAGAMVAGLQSQGVAACVKHYAANNQETDRLRVSADVDERTLREVYLRAFEIAIREGRPWTVMSAYNRINGVFASENPWLLTTVLRDEWGYDGYVISDWGAVHDPVAAVAAGLDLRMPGQPGDPRVSEALANGSLDGAVLDVVVERLRALTTRTQDARTAKPVIDWDAHHQLTRRAAAESAVLLHDTGSLLPLDPARLRSVALIGEFARTPRYQGAGSSAVNPTRVVSALDALRTRIGATTTVSFAPGYVLHQNDDATGLVDEAVAIARSSDLVVIFLGLPMSYEAEGRDRTTIELPAEQVDLLRAVVAVNPRVVVALSNGSAVTTAGWRDAVGSIVEFWLTGQANGDSVADVLLGDVNPSGKLPETVPVRLEDTSSYLDFPGELGHVRYSEGVYVGYRWFDARRLAVDYPFGHGLSYTTFHYADLQVIAHELDDPIAVTVSMTLTNTGVRDGAEVVQVYVGDRSGILQMPERELRAFTKVRLTAGASEHVRLPVARTDLEHFHPDAGWVFAGGPMEVSVGSSSRDIRLRATVEVPGHAPEAPLTVWSPLRDWMANPVAGPALRELIEERGGIKGRMGDLFSDPVSQDSVLGFPLISVIEFPGFPVSGEEANDILARL